MASDHPTSALTLPSLGGLLLAGGRGRSSGELRGLVSPSSNPAEELKFAAQLALGGCVSWSRAPTLPQTLLVGAGHQGSSFLVLKQLEISNSLTRDGGAFLTCMSSPSPSVCHSLGSRRKSLGDAPPGPWEAWARGRPRPSCSPSSTLHSKPGQEGDAGPQFRASSHCSVPGPLGALVSLLLTWD